MEPALRTVTENSWVFLILLSIFVLLAVARILFSKQFETLGNLNLFTEQQEGIIILKVSVNIILAILAGLLIFPFIPFPFAENIKPGVTDALLVIGVVGLYFFIRFLFSLILIFMIGLNEDFKRIISVKIYFRIFAIFALLILNLFMYYSDFQGDVILTLGFIIICLLFVLEYIYQIRNKAFTSIYYSYYFILYLCILEILPILYLIKYWNG